MAFFDLLYVSSMSILKFLLISAYAMFLSTGRIGFLTEQCVSYLNKIVYVVFTPALMFSGLAESVTFEDLLSWWSMPVNVFLTFLVGAMLGWIVVKIIKPPQELQGIIVANCCAGNLGNLPLIIVPSVCQEKGSPFGDASDCKTTGTAYVSFSMALGSVLIWTYAYSLVRASCDFKGYELERDSEKKPKMGHSISEEISDSLQEALVIPCHTASEEDGGLNNESAVRRWYEKFRHGVSDIGHLLLHEIKAPPTAGVILGFFVGSVSQLKNLFVGDSAPLQVVQDSISLLGEGTIPGATIVLGGNLLKGLKSSRLNALAVVLVICVKFILLPVIGVVIVKGASHLGLLPNDPLYEFVLMLQYTVPPAMSIGTMSQLLNVGQKECSVLFFWTYLAAALALTFWCTVFMLLSAS